MLIGEGADRLGNTAARKRSPRRRIWRLAAAAGVALVLFSAATARLLIWPTQGMPRHVSAIAMLAGPGDRLPAALRLARDRRAPVLVISRGHEGYGGPCPARPPRVTLICFEPNPPTTQGEAEVIGRLARHYHWQSVALVTTRAQDTRARIRVERCFTRKVYVVAAEQPWYDWPYQIAYEWAAMVKAVVIQRAC